MALDPLMRRTVERISGAVDRYAAAHGMAKKDYRLFLRIDERWEQIHVLLVANRFPSDDLKSEWKNLMRFIEGDLPDISEHLTALNLTLRTSEQVDEGGIYVIGPDFLSVDELLAHGAIA